MSPILQSDILVALDWGRVLKELGRDSKVWMSVVLITLSIRVTKGNSAGTSLLREGYLEGGEVMVDRVSCQRWWKIMRTWLEESSLPTLMERSRCRWLRWKEACSWVSLKEGGGKQVRVPEALNLWRRDWWRRKGTGGGDHGF